MRALLLVLLVIIGGTFFACEGETISFSMQVMPGSIEPAISGQSCVFLVVVADEGEGNDEGEAVVITAEAVGATVTVDPQAIIPGQVAEVTVIPGEANTGETVTVTIQGERDGLELSVTATVVMGEEPSDPEVLALTAAEMRDKFIPWLAANHPELGITSETEWMGTIVRPNIMVVMYHLFFSEDWEMGISWHVTIPPHDWTRIYLRGRTTETAPSHAFEIPSWSADSPYEAQVIEPPETVWR